MRAAVRAATEAVTVAAVGALEASEGGTAVPVGRWEAAAVGVGSEAEEAQPAAAAAAAATTAAARTAGR